MALDQGLGQDHGGRWASEAALAVAGSLQGVLGGCAG